MIDDPRINHHAQDDVALFLKPGRRLSAWNFIIVWADHKWYSQRKKPDAPLALAPYLSQAMVDTASKHGCRIQAAISDMWPNARRVKAELVP